MKWVKKMPSHKVKEKLDFHDKTCKNIIDFICPLLRTSCDLKLNY